jgi:hypothetical protein
MTRVSVAFEDVEPGALAQIFTILGITPNDIAATLDGQSVKISAPPSTQPTGWDAEAAALFVNGLTSQAFKALQLVCEHNGTVSLDMIIESIGLKNGKALGGVMSSFGHNIRLLVRSGHLPVDVGRVVERNEETRQFNSLVPPRVLRLLTTAVNRRARVEAGRGPEAVAAVA